MSIAVIFLLFAVADGQLSDADMQKRFCKATKVDTKHVRFVYNKRTEVYSVTRLKPVEVDPDEWVKAILTIATANGVLPERIVIMDRRAATEGFPIVWKGGVFVFNGPVETAW